MNGKGSRNRTADHQAYREGMDRIFGACQTCNGRRYLGDLHDHGPTGLLPHPCPNCADGDWSVVDVARRAWETAGP